MSNDIIMPLFGIGETALEWNAETPGQYREVIISGAEWLGPEKDNWEHMPAWYYYFENDVENVLCPETNIRKPESIRLANFVIDQYIERRRVDDRDFDLPERHEFVWDIAGMIEGQR